MYAAASKRINVCLSTHISQSVDDSSDATGKRVWPISFKKFPARIHIITFGRNGVNRYFRHEGTLKYEKIYLRRV